MSRRPQRSVVAVVSVPAPNRLLIVQYKFIELYKESVLPDSCRNHDSESQESEMSECNCNFFLFKTTGIPRLFAVVSGKHQRFLWDPEGSESSSDHLLFPCFV